MFEYKVKCRHKLGWKEIKLYADTDIEEFFNRNSIDYVRNMTDTVEHRQLKEIEKLNKKLENLEKLNNANYQSFIEANNMINELEEWLKEKQFERIDNVGIYALYETVLQKLKKLKGIDKE